MAWHSWKITIAWLAGILAVAQVARGDGSTTQPAPAEWGQVINTIAHGLAGDSDSSLAADTLIPADAPIRIFGSNEPANRSKIKQQTEGLSLLSARVYTWPAETIATDLSTDFRATDSFPESLRKQFVPRDDSDVKRANTIAQLWINRVLNPGAGQFVGIIVLWEAPLPVTTTSLLLGTSNLSETKQPYFVLIKGIKTADGNYHITQIVCGDANQALN